MFGSKKAIKAIKAYYGSKFLFKVWCYDCKQYAIVYDNTMGCCGGDAVLPTSYIVKREGLSSRKRRFIGILLRRKILERQEYRCFYCNEDLYTQYHIDHLLAWCFNGDNSSDNLVAACPPCNRIKSHKIFDSIEGAIKYVRSRRPNLV